jgi:multiple sugar transport system permease protein
MAMRSRSALSRRGKVINKPYLYIGLVLLVTFTLAPFAWLISSSFQTGSELLSIPPHAIPREPTLDNFARLFATEKTVTGFQSSDYAKSVWNSVIVASATTLISLALGTPAAFAFARLQIPFKTILLLFILGLTMLPTVSIIIPLFVTGQKLGLLNTRLFLIVCYTTFSLPFTIWIMNGYFRTIPKEMEDAARIDGCSTMGLFMRIALPLAAPGLAATAIFTFLNAWDEFMMALIFTSTYSSKTLPIAVSEFVGRFSIDWGLMNAGGLVATLPPVVVALLMQKYLIEGLTAGAVKG